MYCPQCSTANASNVKFCRSCGTHLETVALALGGKTSATLSEDNREQKPAQHWAEKRIESVSRVTRGSILLTVSLALGIPFRLFMPSTFDAPWIIIWAVFFGWMAVWGGIEMAQGISSLIESKSRLRLMGLTSLEAVEVLERPELVSRGETPSAIGSDADFGSTAVSVTEHTTRQLKGNDH